MLLGGGVVIGFECFKDGEVDFEMIRLTMLLYEFFELIEALRIERGVRFSGFRGFVVFIVVRRIAV
jgi:hypothetical protein